MAVASVAAFDKSVVFVGCPTNLVVLFVVVVEFVVVLVFVVAVFAKEEEEPHGVQERFEVGDLVVEGQQERSRGVFPCGRVDGEGG